MKVTIALEELLALGHLGAEYDAWLIRIGEGDQFSSGFVQVNPNSKIPALLDRSVEPPVRVFESGSILLYLAEKFGALLPKAPAARTESLNWLFWQMGAAPYLGGGFGHFYVYAPEKFEYAINRFTMEAKRQLDVLDRAGPDVVEVVPDPRPVHQGAPSVGEQGDPHQAPTHSSSPPATSSMVIIPWKWSSASTTAAIRECDVTITSSA